MQELKSLKLHMLEVLYSSLINKTFDNAVEYIAKLFLQSDSLFRPIQSQYSLIAKIISSSIHSLLIYKFSSTFGEFVLNYVRIDTNKVVPISSMDNKAKAVSYILLNYLLPSIIELVPKLLKLSTRSSNRKLQNMCNFVKVVKICVDLLYRLRYIFKNKFLYSDIVDHLLGIMLVNQGEKDKIITMGKQLNLFLLFMFIKVGEWYYSKENKSEVIVEVDPPRRDVTNNNIRVAHSDTHTEVVNSCLIGHSHTIKSPQAVRCCGFVFCENCIENYLKTSSKCPNCLNVINKQYLIKIYD